MRKHILGLLVVVGIMAILTTPAFADSTDTKRVAITEKDKDTRDALIETYGSVHEFEDTFTAELTKKQIKELEKEGKKVEEVGYGELLNKDADDSGKGQGKPTPTVCNPTAQMPWGVTKVNGGSGGTYDGSPVKVAVLDSGALTTHPDLKNNIVMCMDATSRKGIVSGCSDSDGHGTHVAGTIAANGKILGVAPSANLMIIKVCKNSCYWDDLAAAIIYATDKGAKAISISIGGSTGATYLEDAINYAYNKGVLVVAAAGNSGSSGVLYPAAYVNAMAIGAIDSNEAIPSWSAVGLNDGDYLIEFGEVEMGAPGVGVESTYKDGCYKTMDGTSMATPHVSGLAAKLWQGNAADTRAYLQDLAMDHDLDGTGDDVYSGFGLPIAP